MTSRPPLLNLLRKDWPHDSAAVASSEQDSDSLDEQNVAPDQIHLVLTRNELALVVAGLRQYGKLPLFKRLERILANLPR